MTDGVILEAREITKIYPGTTALDRVNFKVRRAKVNVLIGENGAGKSTLVKILAGVEHATSGTLWMDGKSVTIHNTREADAAGIGMIYQELNLCPNLTVTENIFLGRELQRGGVIQRARQAETARALMARFEQDIAPDAITGQLPLGKQQIVEIAKAIARDVRVLIMDEPTSALSTAEIGVLFRVMAELKAQGVAIVYISHKLEELLTVGDYVTVLRDGRLVEEAPAAGVNVGWIIQKMTGGRAPSGRLTSRVEESRAVLRVEGLSVPGRVHGVSFEVRCGEIVGIYGLMGAGRSELFEALVGLRRQSAGAIELDGRRIDKSTLGERIAQGIALAPEDRQASAIVPTLSIRDNITLAGLKRYVTGFYLSPKREASGARTIAATLRIRMPGLNRPITALSGGNQQKTVLARCLLTSPKVLLLDEPTRGVDVGARAEIFEIIRELAKKGIAVVFASSELHEVLTLSDRVLVMSAGHITAECAGDEATEAALVAASAAALRGPHVHA